MCFSATASFTASGGLALISIASFRLANKRQRILATIPLLFAIQQALEGFQWLAVNSGGANTAIAYAFIFFAYLLWPVYIPITVYIFDKKRRDVLKWAVLAGIIASAYYTIMLLVRPLGVQIFSHSICYQLSAPFGMLTGLLYLIAVCGAPILSSYKPFRWFGIMVFISAIIAAGFFFNTFASVWCFFAALLSGLIYLYIRSGHKSTGRPITRKSAIKK